MTDPQSGQWSLRNKKMALNLYRYQMWAWGQDIRHPHGNLLLKYGFHKWCKPQEQSGGSHEYVLVRPDCVFRLWSFGCLLGSQREGMLLMRQGFYPKWWEQTHHEPLHLPHPLKIARKAQSESEKNTVNHYLKLFIREVSLYETWLSLQLDSSYREKVLKNAPIKHTARLYSLKQGWEALQGEEDPI